MDKTLVERCDEISQLDMTELLLSDARKMHQLIRDMHERIKTLEKEVVASNKGAATNAAAMQIFLKKNSTLEQENIKLRETINNN